jgi:GNAT superfamily N-acetyltransferase
MHILDNPIWHALRTRNRQFSCGTDQASYFRRDVAAFAGLQHNSKSDFDCLHRTIPFNGPVILFTPGKILIPAGWQPLVSRTLLQMIYEQPNFSENADQALVSLTDKDIPAMLALTALTNPGPFFSRTIDFGNYKGIFNAEQLVAMAGQRLHLTGFTEVSAVCTHPDYAGRGYAAALLRDQIRLIQATSCIPFLHVYPENLAWRLYEKLGFKIRREMWVYVLEKQPS